MGHAACSWIGTSCTEYVLCYILLAHEYGADAALPILPGRGELGAQLTMLVSGVVAPSFSCGPNKAVPCCRVPLVQLYPPVPDCFQEPSPSGHHWTSNRSSDGGGFVFARVGYYLYYHYTAFPWMRIRAIQLLLFLSSGPRIGRAGACWVKTWSRSRPFRFATGSASLVVLVCGASVGQQRHLRVVILSKPSRSNSAGEYMQQRTCMRTRGGIIIIPKRWC